MEVTDDSLIPPETLKRFLAANAWSIMEDRPREWEIWRSPAEFPRLHSLTLVFDTDYVDYCQRLFEANEAIKRLYHLTTVELTEKITSLSADLFFVRIDQESRDGTIPFRQAQRALESIATMVRAAATTVASPSHSHQGRRPAEVEQFITDDLRLSHTKRGSFVVTAAARFDHDEVEAAAAEPAQTNASPQGYSDPDVVVYPFGRRVMATFSRSLAAARSLAIDEEPVSTAIEQGLSLELAQALEKFSSEEGLQTIEVSFDWSESLPAPPENIPEVVVFDRAILDSLPTVTERLQVRAPGPKNVEIIGQVTALSRNPDDEEAATSGEVTIFAEVDGHPRRVLVDLEGEAHDYAIRAYRERFPVIVSGELVKKKSWRLEGNVSMDLEAARLMAARTRNRPPQPGLAKLPPTPDDSVDG
ncbi:hypothetical protein NJB18091_37210 [Mycobacterium marinum]|uniref:hypothetical protein n=1 Tax=Mycobacterium marinum TaxID=1781 RepID=UPI0021C38EB3|nr:hypothetical protein [Mycobacterium marinum]GJO02366.1 hypothetical protein NJB18091_37210 [Mycobacterium marinum]